MWTKKSPEQIAAERRGLWRHVRGPLLWFLLMFVGGIGLAIQGPRLHEEHWPSNLSEMILGAAFSAGVFVIAIYALHFIFGMNVPWAAPKIMICDTCHRVKHRDGESRCQCGGTFDDFDTWTWVEDQGEEED